MSSHYGYLVRVAAAQRARRTAVSPAPPSPTPLGLGLLPIGPAAGPSPGGQYRQALVQAAQARAAAKAQAVAAMPPIGMGNFGASPGGAGGGTAGANATAALFGNPYGSRPSYVDRPFLRGIFGFADRAGGSYTDPGAGSGNSGSFSAFVDRAAQNWDAALGGSTTRTPPHLVNAGFASTMPARAANARSVSCTEHSGRAEAVFRST